MQRIIKLSLRNMMRIILYIFGYMSFIAVLIVMSLSGCAIKTSVQRNHHLLQADSSKVSVGFLREKGDRYAQQLEINLDGENLLNLSAGQYIFLSLKPGKYELEITNWTIEPGDSQRFQTSRNFIVDLSEADSVYLLFTLEKKNFWEFLGTSITKQVVEKLDEKIDTLTTIKVPAGNNAPLEISLLSQPLTGPPENNSHYGRGYRVEPISRDSAEMIASKLKPAEGAENAPLHK
jgi:hypothetical protein